jgi:phosphoesterase RecJ-like protein
MDQHTGIEATGTASKFTEFVHRNDLFILTTHDPADADGLGAQMVVACILRKQGKQFHILNASPIPKHFKFMDPQGLVEQWDGAQHGQLPEKAAIIMVDTADLHNIGGMRDPVCRAKEIFIIDHHEKLSGSGFSGICDSSAASTCELAVELAIAAAVTLDTKAAFAAYVGIAYDTGFFAYPKTSARTFNVALTLLGLGIQPNDVYRHLHENTSSAELLLQKRALESLSLHCSGKVAVQFLRLGDFAETGTSSDETEGFVNFPFKSRDIVVSLFFKEKSEGKVNCSLRSKVGTIDVSKIAYEFGGGGHKNAAGFKSALSIDQILALTLAKISDELGEK